MIRTYNELKRFETFEERFEYLNLLGIVGDTTFGFERYLNQVFYHSKFWKKTRDGIIIRDNGCDLGIEGREIYDFIIIHHINPITIEDIENGNDWVYDPENLICTSSHTHGALHYGRDSSLLKLPQNRSKGDTSLW